MWGPLAMHMNVACWTCQPPTWGWFLHHYHPGHFFFLMFVFVFLVAAHCFCHSSLFSSCISHVDCTRQWPIQIDQCCPHTGWLMIVALIYFWCLHWNGYCRGAVAGQWRQRRQRRQWRQRHQGPCGSSVSTRRQQDAGVTGIFAPVFYCCFHFFWPPWLIVVFVFLVFQQPGIICIGWLIVFISFSVPPWLIILPLFSTPGGIATGGNGICIINIIQNRYIDYWFLFLHSPG